MPNTKNTFQLVKEKIAKSAENGTSLTLSHEEVTALNHAVKHIRLAPVFRMDDPNLMEKIADHTGRPIK